MRNRTVGLLSLFGALALCSPLQVAPVLAQSVARQLREYDADIQQLKAEVKRATDRLNRVTEMYKAGQISQSELDDAQARLDSAIHSLQRAERDRQAAATRAAFLKR